MKQLRAATLRRPKSISSGTVRTKKDAAIQLVRLEFDISRLENAIDLAVSRAEQHRAELAMQTTQRDKLLAILQDH